MTDQPTTEQQTDAAASAEQPATVNEPTARENGAGPVAGHEAAQDASGDAAQNADQDASSDTGQSTGQAAGGDAGASTGQAASGSVGQVSDLEASPSAGHETAESTGRSTGQAPSPETDHSAVQEAAQDRSPEAGLIAGQEAAQDPGLEAGQDAAQKSSPEAGQDAGQDAAYDASAEKGAGQDAAQDADPAAGQDAAPATDHEAAPDAGSDAGRDTDKGTAQDVGLHAAPRRPSAPVEPAPAVRSALSDPGRWGRVDADGTVYLRTADGERAVGSWQAGEPEEGLAHFARRFDDLLTEVELIATRLGSGHTDPKQALGTIKQLRDGLDEQHVVGDVVGLAARLDYLRSLAEQAVGAARQAREAARAEATARKQALVEEAEKLANEATQWKSAGDRLRAILDEWKTIRGVDRKTDDALWKRFGKARDAFNRRRGSHFAEMDRQRGAAKTRKEEIVAEAEQLAESTEWGATAGRYKQLMNDWKAAGRAPKDADDALWQRFRAAQDAFFARRSSAFNERDSALSDNARKKEQLLAEAERIDPSGDLEAARAQLTRIQERWEAVGHVPRERMRELEGRLRAVEERVRGAADAQWRRTDPEALARVNQFRERVEQFEAQAAKARAAGDERRARRADEQAAQWREWLAAAEQAVADR